MIASLKQTYQSIDYKPDVLLLLFAFSLPIFQPIAQVSILLYLIFWIYHKQYQFLYKIKQSWFAIGAIAYFGIFALSGLYSSNLLDFGADIEAKLSLFIFPLILNSRKQYDKKLAHSLFWTFCIGCFTMAIYLYYEWLLGTKDIFRTTISKQTNFNVIYFSMYLVLVQLFLVIQILKKSKFNTRTIIIGLMLLVLHYMLYAIASRMAILSLIFIELGSIFIWKIWLDRKFFQGILLLLVILLFNGLSIMFIKQSNKRFTKQSQGIHRKQIWKAGLLQYSKSPIIGYGAGDAKDIMLEGYKITKYEHGIKKKFNCHNQYLESGISTGIFGLIIICGWFFMAFVQGWKQHHYLACIVLAIFSLNLLTESMLERQQGTYFIAFFGSLVFWEILRNKNHELHSKTKD